MRVRSSLAFVIVAALASAAPQALQFARTYVVGDSDTYHMQMKMEGQMAMEMNMDLTQKVTKIYDNGDADIESTMSGGKMAMMGRDLPIPAQKATTARMSKYGSMVSGGPAGRSAMGMDFAKYARTLPKEGMTVGQTVNIDEAGSEGEKVHIKGTTKLESIDEGVAKLHTVLDISSDKVAGAPMHMDALTFVETANSKMKRMEGKVTNLAGAAGTPAGMKIESVTIKMERK
jgi:hypothetical protein